MYVYVCICSIHSSPSTFAGNSAGAAKIHPLGTWNCSSVWPRVTLRNACSFYQFLVMFVHQNDRFILENKILLKAPFLLGRGYYENDSWSKSCDSEEWTEFWVGNIHSALKITPCHRHHRLFHHVNHPQMRFTIRCISTVMGCYKMSRPCFFKVSL
jgi:hypothetical protein